MKIVINDDQNGAVVAFGNADKGGWWVKGQDFWEDGFPTPDAAIEAICANFRRVDAYEHAWNEASQRFFSIPTRL